MHLGVVSGGGFGEDKVGSSKREENEPKGNEGRAQGAWVIAAGQQEGALRPPPQGGMLRAELIGPEIVTSNASFLNGECSQLLTLRLRTPILFRRIFPSPLCNAIGPAASSESRSTHMEFSRDSSKLPLSFVIAGCQRRILLLFSLTWRPKMSWPREGGVRTSRVPWCMCGCNVYFK